jgi:hypothetical protein
VSQFEGMPSYRQCEDYMPMTSTHLHKASMEGDAKGRTPTFPGIKRQTETR